MKSKMFAIERDRTRKLALWLAIAASSLFLASCTPSATEAPTSAPTPAASEPPTESEPTPEEKLVVYVSNYPLKYFAERIGAESVAVNFPVPNNIDPAYWSPAAEDIAKLQTADLIFLNGATYEKWEQNVSLPIAKIVDTSGAFRDRYLIIENAVTHSHGPEGEHSHAGTAFTTWLNFEYAIEQAQAVRNALSKQLPTQSDRFEANFQELERELTELDKQIADAIAASENRDLALLASHPVYHYLAERYNLNLESVLWEPAIVPDESQWQELRATLAEHPAQWMLWESEPNPESVRLLKELGVESAVVNPAGNIPESGDFLEVMQANANALSSIFAE